MPVRRRSRSAAHSARGRERGGLGPSARLAFLRTKKEETVPCEVLDVAWINKPKQCDPTRGPTAGGLTKHGWWVYINSFNNRVPRSWTCS